MIQFIKEMADNPHPIFNKYFNYWNFLLQSYEGGVDYTQSSLEEAVDRTTGMKVLVNGKELNSQRNVNLFQHAKERGDDYKKRVQMSYYYNFCSPIIDIYTNHLFNKPIIENFDGINEASLDVRMMDIDNKGSSVSEYRKELADMTQLYGHCFTVCDMPTSSSQIITLQDKINLKQFPYFCLYQPQNVINWSLDAFGQCNWVLLREMYDANIDPTQYNKLKTINTQYRLLTKTEWILVDEKFEEIGRGVHGLGKVPIVCSYDKPSKKVKGFFGISTIADIAFIARDVYNSCSELRQILRDQTFAFLALQGTADEYKELTIGVSKGLLYPEGRNAPTYVSPPPVNAQVYFDHIDRQVTKMFQLAKLEGGSAQFKGQEAVNQSGVAKAWDFNQTNASLSRKSENLEDAEEKLWALFAEQDGTTFDGNITYPDEFSVKDLNNDLDEAEKLLRINLGKTFASEVKKAIVRRKFPRMSEEDLEVIDDEIDSTPEPESNGNGGVKIRERFPFLFKNKNANSAE